MMKNPPDPDVVLGYKIMAKWICLTASVLCVIIALLQMAPVNAPVVLMLLAIYLKLSVPHEK